MQVNGSSNKKLPKPRCATPSETRANTGAARWTKRQFYQVIIKPSTQRRHSESPQGVFEFSPLISADLFLIISMIYIFFISLFSTCFRFYRHLFGVNKDRSLTLCFHLHLLSPLLLLSSTFSPLPSSLLSLPPFTKFIPPAASSLPPSLLPDPPLPPPWPCR